MAITISVPTIPRVQLSSVDRLLFYTELNDSIENRRSIDIWLSSTSQLIKSYLDRDLIYTERTEYYPTVYKAKEYFTRSYPIYILTNAYYDPTGEFTGSETEINDDEMHIGIDQRSVVFDYQFDTVDRGLKLVYTAGLANHATNSVFEITPSGSFTENNVVIGDTYGACGIIVSSTITSITVSVLYGTFYGGETVTEYENLDDRVLTGTTAVIDEITSRSLVETYPDIVTACEMEVRYYIAHKSDFENSGTNRDGTTLRRSNGSQYMLQPETQSLLNPYRRLTGFY